MTREIRFDDIDSLHGLMADDFGPFGSPVRVTQEMIDTFADLTGDHQWIHVDVERAARESPFGGTIAHGFLTLAMAAAVRPDYGYRITAHSDAMNYGVDRLRFLAPVPTESAIHARTRVVSVERKETNTLVGTEMAIHVVGSDKPSAVFTWKILYRS